MQKKSIIVVFILLASLIFIHPVENIDSMVTRHTKDDRIAIQEPNDKMFSDISFHSGCPEEQWNKTYGGNLDDIIYWIQQTDDDGFIMVGIGESYGSGTWLIKLDSDGNEEWNKTYPCGGIENCVLQTSDYGFIFSANTGCYGAGKSDIWLVKTDEYGNELWNNTFGGLENDFVNCFDKTDDGGYIILGDTFSYGNGDRDIWLIKCDEYGAEIWNSTFGGTGNELSGYGVSQTNNGGYIFSGLTESFGAGDGDVWLVKTDSNGYEEWNRTFGGGSFDAGWCVQQTSDSGFILSGETETYSIYAQEAIWLIKTDINGDEVWNKTFDAGVGRDSSYIVRETNDNGYVLIGDSYVDGDSDGWLIKTDNLGNLIWDIRYGGNESEDGWFVEQTSDGGYIVLIITRSFGAGAADTWLIKLYPDIQPDTVYVDDDYDSSTPGWQYTHFDLIQDGIDAVAENGTVYVLNGIYYENIIVTKTINLVGANKETTIIDGSGSDDVVYISAEGVKISGFKLQNSGNSGWPIRDAGIDIYSNYNTITNNILINNDFGIYSWNPSYNIVSGNTFINNRWATHFYSYGNNNLISENTFNSNVEGNIYLWRCDNSIIVRNNVMNNGGPGIVILGSSNNQVFNNYIDNNDVGIKLIEISYNNTISGNNISSNNIYGINIENSDSTMILNNMVENNIDDGIHIVNSNVITIQNNYVSNSGDTGVETRYLTYSVIHSNIIVNNSDDGISLSQYSQHNTLSGNYIKNNADDGIQLYSNCNNNLIINNTIIFNQERGIQIRPSSNNNLIYHNNLIDNNQNAWDECSNTWDNGYPSGGNYWGDYTGLDNYHGLNQDISGADGIGDNPYNILGDSNRDNYPFMNPNGWEEPLVVNIYIDIKPGDYPNTVNPKSKGKLPVAILTNEDFDASEVEPDSINFLSASPTMWAMDDVDIDGDTDLLLHFKIQELNFNQLVDEGDEYPYAYLSGETNYGVLIEGKDTVRLVGQYTFFKQFLERFIQRFPFLNKILNQIL